LGERLPCKQEASGSNPLISTKRKARRARQIRKKSKKGSSFVKVVMRIVKVRYESETAPAERSGGVCGFREVSCEE
jgi:hypothetical protein